MAVVSRHASPSFGEDDQSSACHQTAFLNTWTHPDGCAFAPRLYGPVPEVKAGCDNGPAVAAAARTVLIVEDDPTVADIYFLSLERAGYRVVVAKDGVDGLDAVSREAPDFMFLDIRMPRMDGLEMLRALAGRGQMDALPTVMLTNFDDPALMRECLALGARDYLVKAGTNPAELGAVVARFLSPPRAD